MEWGLLSSLSEDERRHIVEAARRRSFARGEVLVHEGDPADSLHLIAAGRVAIRVATPDGDRATLNILSPGDYFGELSLVRRDGVRVRSATVVALEPTETLVISAATFDELRARQPAFGQLLVAALARRVEQLSAQLLDALYVGLDRRLYRCLLDLARVYGDGGDVATIPLTQEHLADLVGGTRPSVNQILQRLSAQEIVELQRGRVIVRDTAALRRKAGL
jgi:CRP/FNR family transcriptional regulator, cyclic AMP receptor protein